MREAKFGEVLAVHAALPSGRPRCSLVSIGFNAAPAGSRFTSSIRSRLSLFLRALGVWR